MTDVKLDEKGLEAACEAARDRLEIDWDGDEPYIRADSIEAANESAIRAYLDATTPAEDPHEVMHVYEGDGGVIVRENGNVSTFGVQSPEVRSAFNAASVETADVAGLVEKLNDESRRLSGRSLDAGCADSGIAANVADEAAATLSALSARCAEMERMQNPMRTGDVVYHRPSREEWVVAWADHEAGYMAPCGWPTCQARISDCTVLTRADDARSAQLVEALSSSGRSDAHKAAAIQALAGKGGKP